MSILGSTKSGIYHELSHDVLVNGIGFYYEYSGDYKYGVPNRYHYYSTDEATIKKDRYIYRYNDKYTAKINIEGFIFFFFIDNVNDAIILHNFIKNYDEIFSKDVKSFLPDEESINSFPPVKELFIHFNKRML
jgi:hypothetical protein